jgi:hypothetical protein
MKETIEVSSPSLATTVINYILNRFMPFICVGCVLIYACGFDSLVPYIVLAFMWYASKFSFDCGFASAIIDHEMKMLKVSLDELDIPEPTDESVEEDESEGKGG